MPDAINAVTVFCGSRDGRDPHYRQAAADLGRGLAEARKRVVYGGASVGLMGALADAALAAGGQVTGVIPQHLVDLEVAHNGLIEQRIVADMHVRKAMMMELGDAFVALPGGAGTFEEWFEVFTWRMIRLHSKPCVFLNIGGFYAPLLKFLDHVVAEGFIPDDVRAQIELHDTVDSFLERIS